MGDQKLSALPALGLLFVALLGWSTVATAQSWVTPSTPLSFNVGAALQLTDGTILVQDWDNSYWWILKPDDFGNYYDGTWTKTAPIPLVYSPDYFASAVLPDGRVIIEGGEYNNLNPSESESSKGAIYNPETTDWKVVNPPTGWTQIGDAPSIVLPNKTYMLGNINNTQFALLNEKSLTWTVYPGTGKFDANSEEGWTLLPNGKVLTVDTYIGVPYNPTGKNSEIFNPKTKSWSGAGTTVVQLWDSEAGCARKPSNEMGPAVLRPNGTVFATGSNTCSGKPGHTAIYNTKTGKWAKGPNFLNDDDIADGPAAILPDGNVLVETNKGYGNSPVTFYEFNGSKFLNIPQPPGYSGNSEGGRMLATEDGTILLTHLGSPDIWFYHPAGKYQDAWRPQITSFPSCIEAGPTYTISGKQFNGLSQGGAFGDDGQSATNYPLMRIIDNTTKHVAHVFTHNFSTMGVATGSKIVSAQFDLEEGFIGSNTLEVIANGIPSKSVQITIAAPGGCG